MLALGLLSFLQMTCIPGYLCLKLARWKSQSTIQFLVYMLAVSLIVNFCVVYSLVALEFYNPATVYGLVVLEAGGLAWLFRRDGISWRHRVKLSENLRVCFERLELRRLAGCLAFALAVAAFLSFGHLYYRTLGSVFTLFDDTVSWDRWAEGWLANRFPTNAGYYPQLVPVNWSLTYVMIRSTDVKMFAKALMPVFPIATFLLFVDLAFRRKAPQYLLAAAIYGSMLYIYLGDPLIVSGYMETALPFFAFLTAYALLELSESGPSVSNVLLASLFAAGTGLVKQGGLYLVLASAGWTAVVLYQHRAGLAQSGAWRRTLAGALVGLVVVLPWYIRQYLNIAAGSDSSNVSGLAALAAQGRGHLAVVAAAFERLYDARGGFAAPLCWFLAGGILLSLADPLARKLFLWVLAPVLVLWALFFSYEVRTASLAFPFLAFASAAGVGVLLRAARLLSKDPPVPAPARGGSMGYLVGAACVLALAFSLYLPEIRDKASFGWQPAMMGDMARWWAVPLAGSALILVGAGLAASRRWVLTVNWWLAIGFCGWLWLATTTDRTPDIVARQIELQKRIEDPPLNQKLYDVMAGEGFHGKVATDYWVFGRLPFLKQYYQPQYFPPDISVDFLSAIPRNNPGVCYCLITDGRLSAPAREALANGVYRTVWIEGLHRLIQVCGNSK